LAAGCVPNATNTGYAWTGVTLTAYTGPTTITVAGTTIDSKSITGCLVIQANNVTIKRSSITADCDNYMIENTSGATGLLVVDTTIVCQDGTLEGIWKNNYTVRRANISRCENGGATDGTNVNVTVEDSFIHNLACPSEGPGWTPPNPDPHVDGFQVFGSTSGVTVNHNTLYGTCDAGETGSSAITIGNTGMANLTITNNVLAGGGWTMYCPTDLPTGTNTISNNRFSNHFGITVGGFGPAADCGNDETAGIFTGNKCHESGAALTTDTFTCP
jgi:hypothetical protein